MSPFIERVAAEILSSFPEWTGRSRYETYNGSEPYFVVEVPAPPEADTTLPLRISTWDDEVTVDFDYYHTHFNRWAPQEGDTKHQSGLMYVQAILSEEVAVASWWQGELCKMCAPLDPEATLDVPFAVPFDRVRVRSWRGSRNADVNA